MADASQGEQRRRGATAQPAGAPATRRQPIYRASLRAGAAHAGAAGVVAAGRPPQPGHAVDRDGHPVAGGVSGARQLCATGTGRGSPSHSTAGAADGVLAGYRVGRVGIDVAAAALGVGRAGIADTCLHGDHHVAVAGILAAPVRPDFEESATVGFAVVFACTGVAMVYDIEKWLHVLSSSVLFGTGIGSVFYFLAAALGQDART